MNAEILCCRQRIVDQGTVGLGTCPIRCPRRENRYLGFGSPGPTQPSGHTGCDLVIHSVERDGQINPIDRLSGTSPPPLGLGDG
jgi:hypothetical protein